MVVKRANGQTPADGAYDEAQDASPDAVTPLPAATADEGTSVDSGARDDGPPDGGAPDDGAPADRSSDADVPDGQVPVQAAQLIDPRAIARASLEAGRNASLWWTSAGVLVATVVALLVGTRAGAFTLAGVLAACAVARALLPHPGPVAVSVRAKAIDVTVLSVLAVSIGVLAQLLPGTAF